jgi:hypothetical protein
LSASLSGLTFIIILAIAALLRLEAIAHYPTGISNDEAVMVVDAWHTAISGVVPLYEQLGDPEPMYRILMGLRARFFGNDVGGARATSAVIGVLTIAAMYWATLQAFADLSPAARHVGAATAAAALAVALGHITLSRALYRGIVQPPMMLLAFGFVMRGLTSWRWRDFALSGLFLGLTLYTYTSAYVVPGAFVALALALLVFRAGQWRQWLPRLSLTAAISAIVILPLMLRFVTNPQSVIGRANTVAANQFDAGRAITGMWDQLFLAGDENPQYNVANAPVIPQELYWVFLFGAAVLLIRLRHPGTAWLAAMFVLACVPVIASEEITHGLRVVGLFAVFPIICGAGAAVAAHIAARFVPATALAGVFGALIVFFGLASAASAREIYQDYWINADRYRLWKIFGKELNHNEWFFRVDARLLSQWLASQEQPLLVPTRYLNELFVRAWLLDAFPNVRAASAEDAFPPGTRVIIPWALGAEDYMRATRDYSLLHKGEMILFAPLSPETHAQILSAEPLMSLAGTGSYEVLADVYNLPENAVLAPARAAAAITWGNDLQVTAWSGEHNLTPGYQEFTLYWSALQPVIGHEYFMYLQLQSAAYERLTGVDERILRAVYPPIIWRGDQQIPQTIRLDVPALPPGAYRLSAGVYPAFGQLLHAYNSSGQEITPPVTVAWLKVSAPVVQLPDDLVPIDAQFADAFVLRGFTTAAREGSGTVVRLYWQAASEASPLDATVFVHLLSASGEILAQDDRQPGEGQYPTFIWDNEEIVVTEHTLALPTSSAAGTSLRIGMYTLPEVRNLSVTIDGQALDQPFVVVPLEIGDAGAGG